MKKWNKPIVQKLQIINTLGDKVSGTESNSNSNNGS